MGEGTVTANGIRIWYEDFGDRSDAHVVLIMGANATAMSWDAAFFDPSVDTILPPMLDHLTRAW